MDNIFIFKTGFIDRWKKEIKKNEDIEVYLGEKFTFSGDDVFPFRNFDVNELPCLIMPEKNNSHNAENAIILFEALKKITRTQATDVRLWTYLAHVTYWDYMKRRYPIGEQPKEKIGDYIISHWFIDSLNTANLTRYHGIASLWWGAYRTYDETRKDPYELTKELFSMLDYSTHLTSGTQGRSINFFRAVLEFVVQNKELFSNFKESKVRYIMRTVNRMGGYKMFTGLTKDKIIDELSLLKNNILKIKD